MKRWTKQELETISDKDFIIQILNERRWQLTNFYSPLFVKISEVINRLQNREVKNADE